eukprot:CAMPEP_0174693816 /NCGR_PEP_ID=MMETSP1094-20130205/458_1 /TAXON_ID=156173 /ORGANISM="Chrysochromulina brevifilum, Strain UTEX LB 985" /LENGTH=56 /DNA_ID=CAMNT_0015889831 /DNA_START=512 /DNA_END=682 /DNA_ORIENTATION=+
MMTEASTCAGTRSPHNTRPPGTRTHSRRRLCVAAAICKACSGSDPARSSQGPSNRV